jgi:hypothetical protein
MQSPLIRLIRVVGETEQVNDRVSYLFVKPGIAQKMQIFKLPCDIQMQTEGDFSQTDLKLDFGWLKSHCHVLLNGAAEIVVGMARIYISS